MERTATSRSGKPFNIQERLLIFAVDLVAAVQYLQTRGPIARALSEQLLDSGVSIGANAAEADGASSHRDFVAKMRIALKEAKETRFHLLVCRRSDVLDASYDALVAESDELVRIIATIVHRASRNSR